MNMKHILIGLMLAVSSSLVQAHGDHADANPVSREEVVSRGASVVQRLVGMKKLDASWAESPQPLAVESKASSRGSVWIASYANPKEKNRATQTLYLFFDEWGNYMGANHDGKF